MTVGRRHAKLGLSLSVVSALVGCASYSPHLTARPLDRGTTRTSLTLDALLLDRGYGPEWFAAPDLGVRRGVSENWDLGGRVYPLGIELDARGRLGRRQDLELSVVPLVAAGQVSATNADTSFVELSPGASLLGSVGFGRQSALVLGLRSQLRLGLNSIAVHEDFSAARWSVLTGGSLAMTIPLSARSSWLPGVMVLVPYDLDRSLWEGPIVQGGGSMVW